MLFPRDLAHKGLVFRRVAPIKALSWLGLSTYHRHMRLLAIDPDSLRLALLKQLIEATLRLNLDL